MWALRLVLVFALTGTRAASADPCLYAYTQVRIGYSSLKARFKKSIEEACISQRVQRVQQNLARLPTENLMLRVEPNKVERAYKLGLCGVSVYGATQLDKLIQGYIARERAEGRDDELTRLGGHYATGLRYLLMADACARSVAGGRMSRNQVLGMVALGHASSHLASDASDELQASALATLTYAAIVRTQLGPAEAAYARFCR
jgi:hypothetical protein